MTSTGPWIPGPLERLVGIGSIAGSVLWPVGLAALADAVAVALERDTAVMATAVSAGLPTAVATVLFAAAAAVFERRATTPIGLGDLIGDLSIGTGAVALLVASAAGIDWLLGPALVILLVGALVFGLRGIDGRRRPHLASALIGAGAGGLIAAVLALGALGPGGADAVAGLALVSVGLLSLGWAWLGVHLVLARPFPRRQGPTAPTP